jgi:hypothetical protein
MYRIEVIYPETGAPRETVYLTRASEALAAIGELLREHRGCRRLVMWMGEKRLFAVDCDGNRVED